MTVVPALLEKDPEGFKINLEKISGFARRVQVDFNDGTFERTRTLRPEDVTDLVTDYTEKIEFEAHMMVQKPWPHVPALIKAGFKRIIIQYEIEEDIREILEGLTGEGVFVGLAIGPATSVFEIEPYAGLLDTITVLDITPGKQGQKFMPAELEKIRELKTGNFPGEVQADGAIDELTIREVVEAGPDTLVVGSYIVKAKDPKERYEELIKLIK